MSYLGWGLRDYGTYPTHNVTRDVWSYNLILRGNPTLLLADGAHRLSARDAVLFSGHGDYPLGYRAEPGKLCEVLIWNWHTQPVLREARPVPGGYRMYRLQKEACERLRAIHAACRQEVARPDSLTVRLLRAFRTALETELIRAGAPIETKSHDQLRAEEAGRWLRSHLHQQNPIFHLRDFLQVSNSTLARIFRSSFGESAREYLHRLRMEEAVRLMKNGSLSVKEIAFRLGYKHANDFSRAYRVFRLARSRAR